MRWDRIAMLISVLALAGAVQVAQAGIIRYSGKKIAQGATTAAQAAVVAGNATANAAVTGAGAAAGGAAAAAGGVAAAGAAAGTAVASGATATANGVKGVPGAAVQGAQSLGASLWHVIW